MGNGLTIIAIPGLKTTHSIPLTEADHGSTRRSSATF